MADRASRPNLRLIIQEWWFFVIRFALFLLELLIAGLLLMSFL